MEIRQLEYFLAVADTGSFTRAAERLYVSQPAVTNAIRSLEEELGIMLFDRNQKLAALTSEGAIFASHVGEVMHGISKTIEEIDAMKNLTGGVLTIGLTSFGGIRDFAAALADFRASYPAIKCRLVEHTTAELERLLLDDKLDVAILSVAGASHALEYLPLPRQELVLCVSRRHSLRRQNSVPLAALVDEPLVLPRSACAYRDEIIAGFEAVSAMPELVFESQHIQTLKSLVATGAGVTILPETLVDTDDSLATVALDPPLYLTPQLAWKGNRHLSNAAAAFIASVKTTLNLGGADDE